MAMRLRREERFQHPRQIFRGNSRAGVGDRDFHEPIERLRRDRDASTVGCRLSRVGEQVEKHLLEIALAAHDLRSVVGNVDLQVDGAPAHPVLHDGRRGVDRAPDVSPAAAAGGIPGKGQHSSEDPALRSEVEFREHLVLLPLDLVSGRVTERHPLRSWLAKRGVRDETLAWFVERAVPLDVVGINLYPLFSDKRLTRSRHGLRTRMPYASAEIVDRIAQRYWQRYRRPLMITETASLGSLARRREWLEGSLAAVKRVRERGIPLVGYTWWPMFALITWAYRQGSHPASYYVKQMGLWDLEGAELLRVGTPLVELYRGYVAAGSERVGRIGSAGTGAGQRRENVS